MLIRAGYMALTLWLVIKKTNKHIFGLHFYFWHRALRPLGFPRGWEGYRYSLLCANEVKFEPHLGMGAGCWEPTLGLEGWNSHSHLSWPLGGEMDWRLNQPVINDLVNKTCVMKPPKPPQRTGFRASALVNMWRFEIAWSLREGVEVLSLSAIPCSVYFFYLALIELYPFIINWSSSK